jgi:3-oxoadipate enol-lactonase
MSKPVTLGYCKHACSGEGERLQRPVILVRGLGRSSGFWLQFLAEMRQFSDVVCVDLFGTGKSPNRWGRASVSENSEDLLETVHSLKVQNAHLVGISFGGMVAMHAASAASFKTVTVMSSSVGAARLKRINLHAALKLFVALRNSPPKNREFARFLVSAQTLEADPQLPEKWDALWKAEGFFPVAVLRQLAAAACYFGSSALQNLKTPSHFMVSEQDELVPWQNTLEMWRLAQGSQLTILKGYGHDFPTEAPKLATEKIFEFCKSQELVGESLKS